MRHLALLLAAPLLAACATGGGALARVNGEEVHPDDLKREFARHHMALDRIIGDEAEVRRYLEKVIDRRLLIQEGRRMGIPERPDVAALVEAERAEKLRQLLLAEEVDAKAAPTDAQVKAVYETYGYALEIRQLEVATEAEAVALRAQLVAGADFEKLARERSLSPSAAQGGLATFVWGGDAASEKVVFGLAQGELSAPFKSSAGWELVRVEKRVDPKEPPPFQKAAPRIRAVLERRAKADRREAFLAELRSRYAAKTLDCDLRPAELRRLLEAKEADARAAAGRPCITWTGGRMTLGQVAPRVAIEQVEKVPPEKLDEVGRQILRDLQDEQIVVAEARARGLDRRPEVVDFARQKLDDRTEDVLLAEHVLAGVKVTDDDVKHWYETHGADFVEPARFALAQIVVETPEQAADVQRRLAAKEPFAELAATLSKDAQSGRRGGFVGEFAIASLEPEFASVGALKEGEVSAPIRSPRGYHLVKVLAFKAARPLTLDEARPAVQRAVLQPQIEERTKRWYGTLRANARIEVSDAAIRAYSREKAAAVRAEDAQRTERNAKGESRHGGAMDAASTIQEAAPGAPPALPGPSSPASAPPAPVQPPAPGGPAGTAR